MRDQRPRDIPRVTPVKKDVKFVLVILAAMADFQGGAKTVSLAALLYLPYSYLAARNACKCTQKRWGVAQAVQTVVFLGSTPCNFFTGNENSTFHFGVELFAKAHKVASSDPAFPGRPP